MSRTLKLILGLFLSLQAGSCIDRLAGLSGSEVVGDGDQVTISGKASADSLVWAVAHCSRYGRSAQFVARVRNGTQYRCVKSG